jgi:primosomal protein N' (replication factor Y)
MAKEFTDGHRSMFSRPLSEALTRVREAGDKAVLFLNRRGFASFLLCRECGYVPTCDSCATSLTYHEAGSRLMCHHCGATRPVPARCPECQSPYLRQFGAGTQRIETELSALAPGWPIVRMDADTTRGRGAHERLLAAFEALYSGVLLGTQMIAKGLDFPEITLVGVISADVTLNLPDFRAGERTYQLLEQVAGRAGRGAKEGTVLVQTYWPDHPAIRAAAAHEPALFYGPEQVARRELGYPPFGQLANILVRGRDAAAVKKHATALAAAVRERVTADCSVLGPSPAPLARLKGVWRWHILVKTPAEATLAAILGTAFASIPAVKDVSRVADIDAYDLL